MRGLEIAQACCKCGLLDFRSEKQRACYANMDNSLKLLIDWNL